MAADLHIHVRTPDITEENMRAFFGNTLGSKYFKGFEKLPLDKQLTFDESVEMSKPIYNSPNVWIGEVSWLKAGLLDDPKTFIPSTVEKIHEIVGEDEPIIDELLISDVADAFDLPNDTQYDLNKKAVVIKFLKEHLGEPIFTVSW